MGQSNAYSDLRVFGEIKAGELAVFGEYSLPTVDGLANQILVTDGAGNVTFQDASSVALTPPAIVNGTGLNWTTIAPNTVQGNVTLAPFTTTNLAEGANLYYTDERVDDRVNALLINGLGITKAYNDLLNTLTLGVTLVPFSTTDLAEGTNLYYTDERVEDRMAAVLYKGGRGTGPDAITWTHIDGFDRIFPTVSLTPFSTDDLAEGTTNLYLTEETLYDLMDQIIQDSGSVTWTRDNITNQLTPNAATQTLDVQLDGTPVASNATLDFITTPSIAYTINDDIINSKTTVQIDVVSDAVIIEGVGVGSAVRKDNLNNSLGAYSTVSGGSGNTASGYYSTIAGGTCNAVTSVGSFVGGGTNHNVSGDGAVVSFSPTSTGPFPMDGGYYITTTTTSGLGTGFALAVQISGGVLTGWFAFSIGINYQVGDTITIDGADIDGVSGVDDILFTVDAVIDGGSLTSGGFNNDVFGVASSIGGGFNNMICGHGATIGGGAANVIGGLSGFVDFALGSTISGGDTNTACGYDQTIGGGIENTISSTSGSTIGGGDSNSITIPFGINQSGHATIAGGNGNMITAAYGTIGGGRCNFTCSDYSTIGGGCVNSGSGYASTVGGGGSNTASGYFSVVSGGGCNQSSCDYSTVAGGRGNTASNKYTTVSGGYINVATDLASSVGGGAGNVASGLGSTVSGGACNIASDLTSSIGGGSSNISSCCYSTISGGAVNIASGCVSTVGGGAYNIASNTGSSVGGGFCNTAVDVASTVSGGYYNSASCKFSTIGGGSCNTASCDYSTISGGMFNTASGSYSSILGGCCNVVTHDYASAVGCSITSVCAATLHTNYLNLYDVPAPDQCNTAFLVRGSDGMVNYRTYGGLFSQTGNSATVTNTITETTIIDSGVGTLTVPANGFQVGDAFHAKMAGVISSQNGHTITINIKSGSTVLATTGTVSLPNLITQAWNLDIQFIIRSIGGTGSLHSSGWFSYNSGGNHVGLNFNTTTSPFDTTASHTLDITVTWGTASTNDAIYSTDFTLHKIF